MIIERVTERRLADVFERHLFKPLGMSSTYVASKPLEGITGRHGHGYYPDADGVLHDVDWLNMSHAFGAGGVISTARDITTFMHALEAGELLPSELQEVIRGGRNDPPTTATHPCANGVGASKGGSARVHGTHVHAP